MIADKKAVDYTGSIKQIGGLKRYTLSEGRGKGVEVIEVNNGDCKFDVVLDRGMDICHFDFKGNNVSYVTKAGIVAPHFYDGRGYEWLRGFFAGLFTTCGMINAGEPGIYGDREYGLHGEYSYTPAENISVYEGFVNDIYEMSVSGKIRLGMFLFESIIVTRTITTRLGSNCITIKDEIHNDGNKKEPFMLGYHFNFGYPLLNENSKIVMPVGEIKPLSPEYENMLGDWDAFDSPYSDIEAGFWHKPKKDANGNSAFLLINDKLEPSYAFMLEYNAKIMRQCLQWKHFKRGEYCFTMQPANNMLLGAKEEEKNNSLEYILPGEIKSHEMRIFLFYDKDEILKQTDKLENF